MHYHVLSAKWQTESSNFWATIPVRENKILKSGRKTNRKVFVTAVRNMKQYQSEARNAYLGNCWCPLKCFEGVLQEWWENVFGGFRELGDWTAQNAFLCGSVKVTSVKRRYAKKGKTFLHSQRNHSHQYYINNNGNKQQRNVYSGMQKGFLGHLCYIQWQAFSCSIENAKCGMSTDRSKG